MEQQRAMLNDRTVFVLGAGSSADFGLPTGEKLIDQVHDRVKPTPKYPRSVIGDHLRKSNYSEAEAALRVVERGLPRFRSIDDFLFTHSDDPLVVQIGKLAIAVSIAEAERESFIADLWHQDRVAPALVAFRATWASILVTMLVTGMRRAEPDELFKNLSIVTFNYDRCLEAILFHAIQPALRLSQHDAIEIMKSLKILRPYGGLGDLAFDGKNGVAFGGENVPLGEMASRIRVYTESAEDPSKMLEIQKTLVEAATIVYLGFAFHKQNMQILTLDREAVSAPKRQVLATAYGLPAPSIDAARSLIECATYPQSLFMGAAGHKCREFLYDHQVLIGS